MRSITLPPPTARAILADAVRKRRAIAIFEGVNVRAIGLVAIPLLVLFDGTVSLLRLYLEDELRELVASVPDHETFEWDIGTTSVASLSVGPIHLVGIPKP